MMKHPAKHRLGRPSRPVIASLLTGIYLLVALSPLTPLALQSEMILGAVTGNQCSGDCNKCGCPLESRLNKTCCCNQKKLSQLTLQHRFDGKFPDHKLAVAEKHCSSCIPKQTVVKKSSCCENNTQLASYINPEPEPADEPENPKIFYKCGSPCGKGKSVGLLSFGSSEQLPPATANLVYNSPDAPLYSAYSHSLVSLHSEPPDPPPKIRFSS